MHPDRPYVKNRHTKLCLNKALSERTWHLASDAKHNPMLGWLIPCGTRRLRFNGDTEGNDTICLQPPVTSHNIACVAFLSPSFPATRMQNCLPISSCIHSSRGTQTRTHKSICVLPVRNLKSIKRLATGK